MSKVAQIEERGATVAWSPLGDHADVMALGSKDSGTTGFDDYGGELELCDFGITSDSNSPQVIGSVKTTSRFSSIGWTAGTSTISSHFTMGLIGGGMDDGSTHIWNPAAIVSENGAHSLVAKISQQKSGAVSALAFNPHPTSANLLATGGSQGEILITSLDNPEQPAVTYPSDDGSHQNAEITNIAWNSEVAHIVASSAGDGTAAVWDLRQSKLWCQIRCEGNGGPVSSLGWNPSQGMHLMTASSDDRNPVLKLWDLRASMSMPLATLEGHTQGILGMHWCPHDDSLLVSCGKDNQTLLWDVPSLKAIADIPNEEIEDQSGEITKQKSSSELYGHGLSTSQQRRYDVQWSPIRKGILSTCSFDRKVQIHSVIGAATKCGRPPKWMKPASGVSCGMGGSVVSFASTHKLVTISSFVEQEALKEAAVAFEAATTKGDYSGFSYEKAQSAAKAGDAVESQIWGIMQCIFEENAREKLLFYLGFDPSEIQAAAMKFDSEEKKGGTEPSSTGDKVMMSKSAENIVHKSLLVGNFEAAVECCFRSGNLADALVLASCGGPELWSKTQARYFASQSAKRPFLSVVSSVVHNKLKEFVAESDPSRWHETLAILCTYATSDDFVPLCEALGDHLANSGNIANASIVFMCAMNLEKASQYWEIQLRESEKYTNVSGFLPLHSYVEKVAVFLQASSNANNIPENVAENLFQYSKVLSEQGLFEIAAKYCKGSSQESRVLRDRLYRGKDSELCLRALGSPPEFPFEFVNVGVAPKKSQSNGTSHSNSSSNYNVHNNSQGTPKHGYGHDNGNRNGHSNGNTRQQTPHQNGGTTSSMLPSGWLALQDPSSGRTYYANQSTGQTSWESPSVPENTTKSYVNNTSNQIHTSSSRPTQPRNPSTMVSKYGDGFVTSASHPELGEQYGNLGTSNPYGGDSSRPGIAVINKVEKPPVSGTFNPQKIQEFNSEEFKPLVNSLLHMATTISGAYLTPGEKKQSAEVEKGVAIFSKRLARGDIDATVVQKVSQIVAFLSNREFSSASGIHTELVNSYWKDNKDWLRGMKLLIQLLSKKT